MSRTIRSSERGFTLAEILVAVAVMAIVFITVFSLYDNMQKSFKMSENAANQQQNTRVAFDRLVADVRMAGFNSNPDGDPNRTDEQIEGAWDNAITVRGDYDFEDPTARTTPESTLGGPSMPYRTVSTGNDEIVTYALGKPAATGGTSISFVADVVGVPRNGVKETVSIANVHLSQAQPPYTLYRYIVSPNSTSVVRQPVADNVKSMSLTYYDTAGTVLTPLGGADDPNSVAMRATIAKVGINVVGMTEDPDLAYIDPLDPNANTQHYRKFTLATDVTPRNIGLKGIVDLDLDDPNTPVNFSACQGHCNGTYLKWQPGGDPDIASYTVSWGTSAANLTNVISTTDLHYYIPGITGPTYYAARSIDLIGNQSPNVMVGPSTPTDTTTPAQVTGAACSGDGGGTRAALENVVNVAWAPISGNTTNLSCDESPYPIRDLNGYKIFKGATAGFDPNNVAQVIQTWDPNVVTATVNAIQDTNVVNCRTYYYKIRGEDLCAKTGALSAVADGASTATVPPEKPSAVNAIDQGLGLHLVTWNRVSTSTAAPPAPILIDKYKVYRALVPTGNDPNTASYSVVFNGVVPNPASPQFSDPNVPSTPPLNSYYYKISALDDCLNNESALSLPDQADACTFGGTVSMNISPGGNPVVGVQTITLVASGVTAIGSQLVIKNASTGVVLSSQVDNTAPYTFSWNASAGSPGQGYEIIGSMTNSSGCSSSVSTTKTLAAAVACCISPNNPNISPSTGALKNNEVYFDIINNCNNDVLINQVGINWTNNAGQNALLDLFDYNVLNNLTTMRSTDLSPDAAPIPIMDFTVTPLAPELELLAGNSTSNPVRLRVAFTRPMFNKIGTVNVGESIETMFWYTIKTQSGIGRCSVVVVTNPLSLVICDPATDPNCIL